MCNDFGNRVTYREYVDAFSNTKVPLLFPEAQAAPNLEPRDEIWPSERASVIRPVEGGVELVRMPWGLSPNRPKAPLIINMRSEGREFSRGRCLIPASHYYEFTGTSSPKTRWRFTVNDTHWFCFAGLIGQGPDDVPAFSLLTCDAGPDIARYHKRQPIVLTKASWEIWIDPSQPAAEILKPSPKGTMTIVEAPREETMQRSLL